VDYPTAKGARQAEAIVDAAIRCLARDGYARTSMQRIADEAGVNKRMVHYYFDTREQLFDELGRSVGDRLLAGVADAVERLWKAVTDDPELQAVYFGLVAESVTDPALRRTVSHVKDGYRDLIRGLIVRVREHGMRLRLAEDSLTILILAGVQGLTLEYLEHGDSPALAAAIEDFKDWMVWVAVPAGERR
jgi:TetR/AcrR family transcriptional regulator, transcriptional repressor of bet genes